MYQLRVTTMPSVQKLLELERLVVVDNAGPSISVSSGPGAACLVGEFLQGPFSPAVMTTPGDITGYFVGANPSLFSLISQSGFDPSSAVQDGSGVAYDGNGWAELKGKTFTGLVIQRVDCDMCDGTVPGTPAAKVFVSLSITVNAADISGGVTNKAIVIPAGTRFADAVLGTAVNVVAISQQVTIPAGTACSGTLACGINFVQDPASGQLTYSTTPTMGITAFFVKGGTSVLVGDVIAVTIDTALPGVNVGTVIGGAVSVINGSAATTPAVAPCGGGSAPSADTLANRIMCCYAPAISKTLPGTDATNNIIVTWPARNYQTSDATISAQQLRINLWRSAINASATGRDRVACVAGVPALGTTQSAQTTSKALYQGQVVADGVRGQDQDDRYWLSGPYQQVFSSELNRDIQISSAGFRAAMKVNLFNAGQSQFLTSVGTPYNANIQGIDAQEPCYATIPLIDNPNAGSDYVAMRAAGVSWMVKDRTVGWWFYSGVTASDPIANSQRVDDNRRSFAGEIEDVIFSLATRYAKLPGITERQDAFDGDMRVYLDGLVEPAVGESRAVAYSVTDGAAAGNTPALNAEGIYLFQTQVQMYGSMKTIVINAAIGPNVVIAQVAIAA